MSSRDLEETLIEHLEDAALHAPTFVLRIKTHDGEQTLSIDEEGLARPAELAHQLGAKLHCAHNNTWRLTVEPQEQTEIISCSALFKADLRGAESIYLNGYQSWTDSYERRPQETMRGLRYVPKPLVDAFVLDGSGDYRFTQYRVLPGESHGWGYGYLNYENEYLFFASLNENTGFTRIRSSVLRGCIYFEKEVPARALAPREECELIGIVLLRGNLEGCVDSWLKLAGISPRPAPALVGYSSWYRHYNEIDEDILFHDLQGASLVLEASQLGSCEKVFQVDDGWCTVGDWDKPHADTFPHQMSYLAREISERGFIPGLWLAPFLVSTSSEVYAQHPDWLLKDDAGNVVKTGSNWGGAVALDILHPEVRAYIARCLERVTKTWGFKMLKLDFLFAACMLVHGNRNRGELMADALDLIRESVGEDILLDFCGVPLISAFGKSEYCRIGCDVSPLWDDVFYMRPLHRERVSSKRSLQNTYGRAHLDGKAFGCDPDVFYLRDDVKLSDGQKKLLLEADSLCGSMFLTSDDMGAWNSSQRSLFTRALATFTARFS